MTSRPTSHNNHASRHLSQIMFEIWKSGPVSRATLSQQLGLSLPTIANAVAELKKEGVVTAQMTGLSTGGRRAQLIDIQPSLGRVIGVSFTSRGISAASATPRGQLSQVAHYPFNVSIGKRDEALALIMQAIQHQLDSDSAKPLQIGLVVSGFTDRATGTSLAFPRFEDWTDVPLVRLVEDRFGIPAVLDSHIAATTLAELLFGQYRGFRNALYIQLGPGLGMGIVINGELYRGSAPNVGEFGHVSIREEGGPLCYCGNYGCLESLAGDHALIQQAQAGLAEGVQTRLVEAAGGGQTLSVRDIFRAAEQGDRFSLNIVERAARLLGTAIANVTNLLAPDIIILGGTMTGSNDLLLDLISNTLHTKALNPLEKHLQICTGSFGRDETVTGAAATALYHYFSKGHH